MRLERPLFLFDGHCRLCSGGVATLMKLDRRGRIDFASAQSELGRTLFARHGRDPDLTYLLIVGDEAFGESEGYLKLCSLLGGPWHLLAWSALSRVGFATGCIALSRAIASAGSGGPSNALC